MSLHPQSQWVLDLVKAAGRPTLDSLPVDVARAQFEMTVPLLDAKPAPMASVVDRTFPGPGGAVPVRVYVPHALAKSSERPALIFLHGGGWVIGGLNSYDAVCRALADRTPCAVVSVDYRLAPEHKFPAALEDAVAAVQWVHAHAAMLGIDPRRLAIGGDSAGGNLSAAASQELRRLGGPMPIFQLLIYPATDMRRLTQSHKTYADGYLLTGRLIDWFRDHYLGGAGDKLDPRASPALHPDLSGLPPALIITAGYDPLCDEGAEYARALAAAGVIARESRYEGMLHGFFNMSGALEDARHAIEESSAALAEAFRGA